MSTIRICGKPPQGKPDKNTIHIPTNVNPVTELSKQKDNSVHGIVFEKCGLSLILHNSNALFSEFHRVLSADGYLLLTIERSSLNATMQASDFRALIRNMNSKFFLYRSDGQDFYFSKMSELNPTIVTPEEINLAVQRKQRVEGFFHFNAQKKVCEVVKSHIDNMVKLGEGKYGSVYFYPNWNANVVVKVVAGISPNIRSGKYFMENNIGPNGERETTEFLEVFSSASLNDLTIGKSRFGHSIHIPRFEGFFSCLDSMSDEHELYIIEERLDSDFSSWIRQSASQKRKEFKCMLWQCFYIMVSLNKMGWSHGDASTKNFLTGQFGNDYYHNHINIGSIKKWVYRLDKQEWHLENLGHLIKISDFGFMQHFKDPKFRLFQNSFFDTHRVPTSRVAPGADIGYFMLFLINDLVKAQRVKDQTSMLTFIKPLYREWFALLGVPTRRLKDMYKMMNASEDSYIPDLTLPSGRLVESLEDIDVSPLLNSSFFDDVLSH